ncbi:MFS transporter [Mitsuaria sp. GD03876]|uniref:MFS transporter n=1 Tax=Mitsuaria sp. GD03876 TaxID=2975399 RepID=UPI00244D340B|nr:MFS transporter [Mitsuaria sp. GD03876]MDH0863865.1 MFS transporter [Mitsuaria sp. GD03876]
MTIDAVPAAAPRTEERGGAGPLVVLAVLTLVNAAAQSGSTLLSAVLPLIKAEFGFSDAQLGLLTGYGSAVSYALLALPISHWAGRHGNSLVLAVSMAVCAVANFVTAGCSSLWHLIAARLVAGTGPAAAWPLGQALVAEHFPPRRRSGAMAAYTAGDFIGGTLPLVIGAWLAVRHGWRSAFLVFGVAMLGVALLQRWLVRDQPAVAVEPVEASADDEPAPRWQDGVRELMRQGAFVHIMFAFSWASFAVYGLSQWMPSFYNRQFGLRPDEAAAFFGGAYAGGALLGLLLGGVMGNRIGGDRMDRLLVFCMGTYLLTFPCILGVLFAPSLPVAFAAHVAATTFGAMPNGPVLSMIHGTVPRRLRVLASSVFLLVLTLLGNGGGPLLIGLGSDLLAARYGGESLKYAMLAVKLLGVMLFIHLGIAWRNARRDARQ